MSAETNKAIVRRYIEQVFNERRPDLLEEFLAEDFDSHTEITPGLEGARQFFAMSDAAFPNQ